MTVHSLDPLQDSRWPRFLLRHPRSSVFHTPAWLEALRRTYGYAPSVLTTSAPGCELADGLVFCRVNSRLTGRRAVSLPFSDHCEPLADAPESLPLLFGALRHTLETERLKYAEFRPASAALRTSPAGFGAAATFWLHTLDLRPGLEDLYRGFHKDCVQRKLRRAERESLQYEEGRSGPLLESFYRLLLLTRRRHGVAPQPFGWFRALADCLGDALTVHIAAKDGRPVAGLLTLRHKNTLVYKYGGSEARYNPLGGMQFLFWHAIRQAKDAGLEQFDLGRTDTTQPGLIAFKDRWGSTRSELTYWRSPAPAVVKPGPSLESRVLSRMVSTMPASVLTAAGRLLYRHVG